MIKIKLEQVIYICFCEQHIKNGSTAKNWNSITKSEEYLNNLLSAGNGKMNMYVKPLPCLDTSEKFGAFCLWVGDTFRVLQMFVI